MTVLRPTIPIRLAVEAQVNGQDRDPLAIKQLHIQDIARFRTTNIVTSGSAKMQGTFLHHPKDEWLYHFSANDRLTIQASISGTATPNLRTIWTGLLDNPQHGISLDTGSSFPVSASTIYKLLEVTTEGDYASGQTDAVLARIQQGGIPASQIIQWAAQAVGIPDSQTQIDTSGPDIRSVQTPIIGYDPSSYPGMNHQFQNWSAICAGAAQMVGRELFSDELGRLIYRTSHYEDAPVGTIRKEWIINPVVSIDSDIGLANQIRVNYGPVESNILQGVANPPQNYPLDHYRRRQLNIAAPWILDSGSAQWYAEWILSWAMHNTRPGTVQLAFAPDIICGECYILPYPQPTVYYVMSVVHDFVAGKPPTTTLGLSYGRSLGVKWFDLPAPADFGGQHGGGAINTAGTGLGDVAGYPSGANWRITHYTPAGLQQYPDDGGGYHLQGFYGYSLYPDHYLRKQDDPRPHLYGSVRECAIDPSYEIPELSGGTTIPINAPGQVPQPVTLTKGDMLMLKSSHIIIEVGDTIGTDATSIDAGGNIVPTFINGQPNPAAKGKNGRQLDLFYWDDTGVALPDYDDVIYLYVQNAGMTPPPFYQTTSRSANLPVGSVVASWTYGGAVASAAQSTMSILGADPDNNNRVAPARSPIARFCHANGAYFPMLSPTDTNSPQAQDAYAGDCQCVLLVRYAYQIGGSGVNLHAILSAYQADDPDGWIADGMVNISGTMPNPGDILVFSPNPPSQYAKAERFGHVAIITAVTPPTGTTPGSVSVAQSNVTVGASGLPLQSTWPLIAIGGGGFKIVDRYPNGFGPTVRSLLRYAGGSRNP